MAQASQTLHVRVLDPSEYAGWRSFVDSSSTGSVYSYPEYLDALSSAVGGTFRVLCAFKGEEIHGGIALYEVGAGRRKIVSSRLLLYYNGVVLRDFSGKYPGQRQSKILAVLGVIEARLRAHGYAHTLIRNQSGLSDCRVFLGEGWKVSPSYSYIMRISDLAAAFGRIDQNQRRLIRRCEEAGVSLTSDTDFAPFFRMHEATHRRKGAPLYLTEKAFQGFFERLSSMGLCRLFHARSPDGRPIASQLVLLGGHPVTHTVAAAAEPEFQRLGTTPFLRWGACEALSEDGYGANDLTDAALNEVTRFKSQMGGELVTNFVISRTDSPLYGVTRAARSGYRRIRRVGGRALRRAFPNRSR